MKPVLRAISYPPALLFEYLILWPVTALSSFVTFCPRRSHPIHISEKQSKDGNSTTRTLEIGVIRRFILPLHRMEMFLHFEYPSKKPKSPSQVYLTLNSYSVCDYGVSSFTEIRIELDSDTRTFRAKSMGVTNMFRHSVCNVIGLPTAFTRKFADSETFRLYKDGNHIHLSSPILESIREFATGIPNAKKINANKPIEPTR
jgi:hypothetical protein